LKDIFEKVGSVKHAQVNYNQNGASLGTAEVKFHSNKDAEQAVAEYDGAEVDGKPMYLKLVGNVVTAPVVVKKNTQAAPLLPLALPSALAAVAAASGGFPGSRPPRSDSRDFRPHGRDSRDSRAPRQTGPSRGGRGGQRGGRRPTNKPASAEDLDAELESYHSSKPAEKTGEQ
jgi:THO complex subunit 4